MFLHLIYFCDYTWLWLHPILIIPNHDLSYTWFCTLDFIITTLDFYYTWFICVATLDLYSHYTWVFTLDYFRACYTWFTIHSILICFYTWFIFATKLDYDCTRYWLYLNHDLSYTWFRTLDFIITTLDFYYIWFICVATLDLYSHYTWCSTLDYLRACYTWFYFSYTWFTLHSILMCYYTWFSFAPTLDYDYTRY
jgi:hypothetical protein